MDFLSYKMGYKNGLADGGDSSNMIPNITLTTVIPMSDAIVGNVNLSESECKQLDSIEPDMCVIQFFLDDGENATLYKCVPLYVLNPDSSCQYVVGIGQAMLIIATAEPRHPTDTRNWYVAMQMPE